MTNLFKRMTHERVFFAPLSFVLGTKNINLHNMSYLVSQHIYFLCDTFSKKHTHTHTNHQKNHYFQPHSLIHCNSTLFCRQDEPGGSQMKCHSYYPQAHFRVKKQPHLGLLSDMGRSMTSVHLPSSFFFSLLLLLYESQKQKIPSRGNTDALQVLG